MDDSMVKRFMEYKPPAPSSPEAIQNHHRQQLHSQSPLHHYRILSNQLHHPGGMACSPSPEASVVSSSEASAQPQARPPSGPKAKFTLEDDALLIELKEKHELTWKRISEYFPGRSSGTLQVRYCTKLKAKGVSWTDDMVGRLRNAMHEYESEKWRIISNKVGHGFSAAACAQKAEEMDLLE